MAQLKTQQTELSVADYIAAIESQSRRNDCMQLGALIERCTGWPPRMWGPGIVGFGRYAYRYDSGRTGEMCVVGFASRKSEIAVYLKLGAEGAPTALLGRLGKHKMGKGCLYINKMTDLDLGVLEELVRASVAEIKRRYPA
ncbi:MAG: DUF1801 domain-containing protein [Paucibacter sp.]|nr:DUF1801 domain-containing protein [Roseateles sp.]